MKPGLPVCALLAALVLTASSCDGSAGKGTAMSEGAPSGVLELTVGYSRLRISLPVFVAKERGIFEKHGIRAELVMYDTAQPLMQALVEGRVDVAGYTALPITYNGMLRSGTKLYFLTAMVEDRDHRISYLLRRKTPLGEEPAIKTIADLRGRTVGILPTIAYKAWLETIVEANGVGRDAVDIRQIEPALQGRILASGGIDALFTNDPAATSALAAGVAELVTDSVEVPAHLGEPFLFGSFNVSKEWADANPEAFGKLVATLDEAVAYVNHNPAEAKRAMRPYLPDAFKPHVDRYPDARYLPTSETSEADFIELAARYHRMGIISGPLGLTGLVPTTTEKVGP